MTDNDIIKALEEEKKYVMGLQHRLECHGEETPGLIKNCVLLSNTLNLINRQKAEIEQWKEEANKYQNLWCEAVMDVQTAKAEAVKEFAERLRNKLFNYYDGLTEHTSKSNHNGDSLMFYEVADMIKDCIESTEEEMTEEDNA